MSQFMRAHGYLPGPTQRPVLTGTLVGAVAAIAALPLAWYFGALPQVARSVGLAALIVLALWVLVGPLAGALYGRIFMRAANDRRGGWLFGISYGFLLWMLGPVTLVQWLVGHPVAIGRAAQGLFAAHLLFGLILGLLFPTIHRMVQKPLRPEKHA